MATGKAKGAQGAKGIIGLGEKAVSLLSTLLAAALIVYGGYALYDSLYIQNRAYASSLDLQKYRPTIIDDDSGSLASELAEKNADYRAWLTVYDTGIDYPVMQAEDDLYYASHDVFKKSSITGALYLASANQPDFSDNFNLVYGHHMNANALFGTLDRFTDESYADAHRKGVLVTRSSVFDLNVFAVIKTDAYDSMIYKPGNRDLGVLMSVIQDKQLYYDADVSANASKVLAMSTCESAETNGRLVVFASLIEREAGSPSAPASGPTVSVAASAPTASSPTSPTAPAAPGATPTVPAPGKFAPDTTNPSVPSVPVASTTPTAVGGPASFDPAVPDGSSPVAITDDANPLAATPTASPAASAAPVAAEQAEPAAEEILDDANPLANGFRPTGGSYDTSWALLNLFCSLVSLFVLVPFGSLRDKFRRGTKMREANEQGASYERERFSRRLKVCIALEVALAAGAVASFLLTADFSAPMALIDKWTPFMLLFPALSVLTDARLARYRSKLDNDHDNDGVGGSAEAGPQRQVAGA